MNSTENSCELAPRRTIESALSNSTMNEATVGKSMHRASRRILPTANVVKIGGQSITDRGAPALDPLIPEIAEAAKSHHLLLCSGGGSRARHAYSLALDLELPLGVMAAVGMSTTVQNARLLQMLLAEHGGIYLNPEDFEKLPLYFRVGCIPIRAGMPPYEYWAKPGKTGRIPEYRTDAGAYLTGEFLGARSVIYVKDEDGLYTDNPKTNPKATFIPRISVRELLAMNLNDLVVERVVLENMLKATHVQSIQIINGLKPGNLLRALAGEPIGTTIHV